MNVLTRISTGSERTGEPQYTATEWSTLSAEQRTKVLKDIANPESGVRFEFNRDEALKVISQGFNNGPVIGGLDAHLLGMNTKTIVDDDQDIMIQLFAKFPDHINGRMRNGSKIGTIFPRQLDSHLDQILMTNPLPVNQ